MITVAYEPIARTDLFEFKMHAPGKCGFCDGARWILFEAYLVAAGWPMGGRR